MISIHSRTIGASVLVLFLARAPVCGQNSVGVTVKDGAAVLQISDERPLAAALDALARAFRWQIGFEEARLRYAGDLTDMTSPHYVPRFKNDRAYDPRGGPLGITFAVSPETGEPGDPIPIVRKLLEEYHARGYPGRYAFISQPGPNAYIYVFPEAVANESGTFEHQEPVTKTKVTVAVAENQQLIMVLQDVLTQLGRGSSSRVLLGGMAMNAMFQPSASHLKSTTEEGFLFLNSTALAMGQSFWQVLWNPTGKLYLFGYGH
jgi:hypothetical protein